MQASNNVKQLQDKFHITAEAWEKLPNGNYLLQGNSPLYTVEQLLDIDLSHYPVDTIAGFILHEFERMPAAGEILTCKQFSLIARNVQMGKIIELELVPKLSSNPPY